MSGTMTAAVWFALLCGIGAVVYGWRSSKWIPGLDAGNARMQEIAAAIQDGASAYLRRQYRTIALVGVIVPDNRVRARPRVDDGDRLRARGDPVGCHADSSG